MTADAEIVEGLPIACRLPAPELRARERVRQREVFSGVQEVHELAEGYARFTGQGRWLGPLVELIRLERACCPFLRFELHAEQQEGPLWLRLRRPTGTKAFVAELIAPLAGPAPA